MPLHEVEYIIVPATIGHPRVIGDIRFGEFEGELWRGQMVHFRQAIQREAGSQYESRYTLVVGFKASEEYVKSEGKFQQRAITVQIPEASERRDLEAHFEAKFRQPVVFFK
jgi:hypothetical protein